MFFWGLRAFGRLNIDQTRGILVEGEVDEINLGGIFKLTGAGGKPKASLHLALRTGQKPSIDISGAVELLGIRSETQLRVSDKGFFFLTSAKLFNLFEATLEVQGGNLKTGEDIFIKATMKNDLFKFLREEASKAIQQAADEATRKISQAQQTVTNAQQEVNRLNIAIEAMRRTVQAERDRDAQRLHDARQAVLNAQ